MKGGYQARLDAERRAKVRRMRKWSRMRSLKRRAALAIGFKRLKELKEMY